MSTETTKKKIKIDNGTEFAKVYTDKQTDSKLTAKQDVLTAGTNITIKDNVISASGGSIAATALTNEDLDTLKTEGSYYAGGSNTCTNKPTGIDAFGLTIKRVASGYYTQYLTGGNTNTGQVYTRTFTSGAWTSWVKFTQDTQLATKQDKLVSGTNIKSINGNSLLGSGDLTIESGGSDVAIITLTDAQAQSLNNFVITFTQEQATLLENASSFKFIYNGVEIAHGQCGKIKQNDTTVYGLSMILGSLIFSGANSSRGSISDYKKEIFLFSAFPLNVLSSVSLESNNVINFNSYYDGNIFIDATKPKSVYFDTINGKPILHTDRTINEYTIPDTKTISIFGNHSILVPKDSTDTNIDLYNHAIKISGSITSGETTTNLKVYTTITSSNNLEIDSITDLNTILGSSYEVMCSGFYGANSVISISKTAEGNPSFGYNNNGGESLISFSKFTNLVIKDTVKTV